MENIKQLVQMTQRASSITVFTGAGMSTESGIPDFRGEHGIYSYEEFPFLSVFFPFYNKL
ncbi:NAD-dependent SIR2 family protein deacetylase [Anoxybacillus tepidamans]|uniref:protein acetyllysine N-acetyltransferase n=1 Tax=Anoxybacteroides tepidamans TaxID=265948 RepID=A0A7W8IMK6_9BACL|nr:Sir2 family NAD-dependent protein deacetylase [Anoxybacillus tepidamans]MBB5323268.1 NAD-dependent SIR2 family protein deacetylase [Anoxybacillus tepidamans]